MYPVKFEGCNKVLTPPTDWDCIERGDCGDLHINNSFGECKSCWKFTWGEFFRFLLKRRIYLYVVSGDTQPPVKLAVE